MSGPAGVERATVARVAASVREEVASLDRLVGIIGDAVARHGDDVSDIVIVHGVGGLVHDFYTGIEKAFEHVSPALNGSRPAGESWHRELLHSMTLDLPGVRPPVVSRVHEERLARYLRFRHLYRNLYAFDLRWTEIRSLAADVGALWAGVRADFVRFLAFLDSLAA